LAQQVGGERLQPVRGAGDLARLEERLRGPRRVFEEEEDEEAEALANHPRARQVPGALFEEGYRSLWAARTQRPRLGEKGRAVAISDLQPGIQGRRDGDERLEQLEALLAREHALPAEVLHGAQ